MVFLSNSLFDPLDFISSSVNVRENVQDIEQSREILHLIPMALYMQ